MVEFFGKHDKNWSHCIVDWDEDEITVQLIDNWLRFLLNYMTLFIVLGVLAFIVVKSEISVKLIRSVYVQLALLFVS